MTIGVELELQLIDPVTRNLAPRATELFALLAGQEARFKPELYQAMLEVNTGICRNMADVRASLSDALGTLRAACDRLGVDLVSAGSHPFARHVERIVYPAERYRDLIDRNRWLARRLMVFGLHVHVGMRDGDHAVAMTNAMLHYLPHLLALSASSPYWQGGDTGLASCRITIFEALPTAGHPCTFTSWHDFEGAYDAMIAARAIRSIKDLWWDVRPHPDFGTVEVRICDGLPTLSETLAVVALTVALFRWFDEQYRDGKRFEPPAYWRLRENKWRASRWGLEADVVLDDAGDTSVLRHDVERLLEALGPTAAAIACTPEIAEAERMIGRPMSYERQREAFKRSGTLEGVVDLLATELRGDQITAIASP